MANVWFTSDTHFGHRAVIDYCQRPFGSVEEMNEALGEAWNRVVRPEDVVWHLGDFSFRGDPTMYRRKLNGNLHMVVGNHDDPKKLARIAAWVGDVKYLRVEGYRLFLSHYGHRVWRNSHHGAFHLYGHSHGDLPGLARSMDVGVDAVAKRVGEYRPLSLEEVVGFLVEEAHTNHHHERERTPCS